MHSTFLASFRAEDEFGYFACDTAVYVEGNIYCLMCNITEPTGRSTYTGQPNLTVNKQKRDERNCTKGKNATFKTYNSPMKMQVVFLVSLRAAS